MNLSSVFTRRDIENAFRVLRRRRFKKDFGELTRFTGADERELNTLGRYLNTISPSRYWRGLRNHRLKPYRGIRIAKKNGTFRPLLIPHAQDRVVLTAAFPKIRGVLIRELGEYGALGVGVKRTSDTTEFKKVSNEILGLIRAGKADFILKLDFKDFFSSVNRRRLIKSLRRLFKNKRDRYVLNLIEKSIKNDIDADAVFWNTFRPLNLKKIGIPQGLAYSPILASFYALALDVVVRNAEGMTSYRYLDDMIVICATKNEAEAVYEIVKKKSEEIGLYLHPLELGSKTRLVSTRNEAFEFLGIGISEEGLFIPEDAIKKFKATFEEEILNGRIIKECTLTEVLSVYKKFARGWANHYRAICPEDFERVSTNLEEYLDKYVASRRDRFRFMGPHRLTLSRHFLRIAG